MKQHITEKDTFAMLTMLSQALSASTQLEGQISYIIEHAPAKLAMDLSRKLTDLKTTNFCTL